jgi:6-phosphofructokinase 1
MAKEKVKKMTKAEAKKITDAIKKSSGKKESAFTTNDVMKWLFDGGTLDIPLVFMKNNTTLKNHVKNIAPKFRTIPRIMNLFNEHLNKLYDKRTGAEVCRKHGIDGIVVIGGDGSFRGAQKLAAQGINTIGLPGTIDLDIACTDYTIGFDTAVNTAMEAIDKIRDTSTSHERCSIIEVMGRNAGYIALWCGIANGAEDILLPERYDNDEQALINHIIEGRKKGKKHHLIINAEGIGHSTGMARRIEAATGIETRATILGYMQRGGSPTCKDRMYASIMGAYAVDLLAEGKSNRLVAYRDGKFVDYDIDEALAMTKDINDYEFNISALLSK